MDSSRAKVIRWSGTANPTEAVLRATMQNEGLTPYAWSNGPLDEYGSHSHSYNKVIYVVTGTIVFSLGAGESEVELHPGDRLDLPRAVVHSAKVGTDGVSCLEGHY